MAAAFIDWTADATAEQAVSIGFQQVRVDDDAHCLGCDEHYVVNDEHIGTPSAKVGYHESGECRYPSAERLRAMQDTAFTYPF